MIVPSTFNSQADLLKWLKRGGVRWTKKQLLNSLPCFSTDAYGGHIYVYRIKVRKYFVSNY